MRNGKEIARDRARLLKYIEGHPGLRGVDLSRALGVANGVIGSDLRALRDRQAVFMDEAMRYSTQRPGSSCELSKLYEPKVPAHLQSLRSRRVHGGAVTVERKHLLPSIASSLGLDFVRYGG